MKKILCISIGILATVVLSVSCNKVVTDTPNDKTSVSDESKIVTITATLSDAMTKVNFSLDETTSPISMKLTWQEGDKLTVSSATNDTQEFTLDSSYDGLTEGRFTGTLPSGGAPYSIVVVPKGSNPSDYTAQTQTANGTTDHLRYIASAEGVNDLSGTINLTVSSGVFGIIAQLPNDAAKSIKSLTLEASSNIFYNNSNELTITLGTLDTANSDNILKFYATIPAASSIPANTTLFLRFNAPGTAHTVYTRFYEFSTEKALNVGQFNYLKINCSKTDLYAGPTSSDGTTAAKAYLIADKYQLAAVHNLATEGSTTCFKMIDDVDMTGMASSYTPVNTSVSGYSKVVDFNGNNMTISNLGTCMFYVLKGSVYDLILDNFSVTTRGILAEYIQGSDNEVTNVTVSNGKVNSSASNVGGMIGRINSGTSSLTTATITDCTVTGTDVKGSGVVGGLIGFADELVSISGCKYTGGTVEASAQYCGGLLGSTADKASVISNCQVENATVKTTCTNDARIGGLVGLSQFSVQIQGCTVGTESKKVVVNTAAVPDDSKVLNEGGFAGVNYGTITKNGSVRSKAYVNVKSANTKGQQINVGGFVGFHRGTIEYCDADVDMSELQGQYIGGFSGYMPSSDSKADNCTLKGSVRGNNYTGGFVGVINNADAITNCQVLEGTVVVGQSTAGGFAAQIKAGTIENCSAHTDMQSRGGNAGGFAGAITGGTVHNCSSAGQLSQIAGTNNVFGGFAGYVNGVDLRKCSSTVNITVARSYVGGLVGDFQTANTVSECFYNGTISGPASTKGGLIGATQAADAVITNCYTAGELVGSSGTQIYGGIVGELKAGGSVTNCYSTMDMTHGGRAMGGIVGRACSGGWPVSNESSNTISKCIAWNPAITYDGTASTSASCGAIIGYTSFKNTLNNCYRRSDMAYKNSNTAIGTTCQTSMVDQIDCDGNNWAINGNRPAGGTPAGTSADAQYQAPYYGVAAASTATVSSLAQALGWSSDIWDFTGDLPTLK